VDTYLAHTEIEVLSAPFDSAGRFDESFLATQVDDSLAAVVVQSPNFFGIVEDVEETAQTVKKEGALTIAVVVEAVSLGLLKPPGEVGADIVVGEGQSFGLPLDFGGPYLGFFAISDAHKRQMPGRVVGQTVDRQGRRGFVLTLSTREQHIRREKATSNICTNQGLCALMAAVYLCALGRRGLREVAEQNLKKAFFLRRLLADRLVFSGPVFNEFVVRCGRDATLVNQRLFGEGIVGGLPLGRYFADRSDQMLICVTEQTSRADMERFARLLLE
jgi:glycine dehydrogenase subunit 1